MQQTHLRLWNKSSSLAAAVGVAKFLTMITMNLITLFVFHKYELDIQQNETGLLNKSSSSVATLDANLLLIILNNHCHEFGHTFLSFVSMN